MRLPEPIVDERRGWRLMFRQTAGNYRPKDEWNRYCPGDPRHPAVISCRGEYPDDYSALTELEGCRSSPSEPLHLKLVYPLDAPGAFHGVNPLEWTQASNPLDPIWAIHRGYEMVVLDGQFLFEEAVAACAAWSPGATVAVPHNEWQRETMQEAVDSEAHWIGYALPAGAAISSPYGGYIDGEGNTMEENGFHFWAEDAVQGPVRNFDRAVLAATNGRWWMGGASDTPQTDRLRAVCQRPKAPLGLRPLAGNFSGTGFGGLMRSENSRLGAGRTSHMFALGVVEAVDGGIPACCAGGEHGRLRTFVSLVCVFTPMALCADHGSAAAQRVELWAMCGEDVIAFENGTQPVRLNRTHLAASPRSRDESCDGGKGEWVGSGAVRICCHHGVAWCRAAAKEARKALLQGDEPEVESPGAWLSDADERWDREMSGGT